MYFFPQRNNMELELNITKEEFGYLESELKTKLAKARSAIKAKDNGLAKITEKMTNFNARESDLLRQIVLQEEVRRSLHNKVIQLSGNIRVFVRVRPSIPSEEATAKTAKSPFSFPSVFDQNTTASSITSTSTVNVGDDLTKRFIVATEPTKDRGGLSQRRKKLKFGFDNVFTPTNTQDDVWEATEPLVQSAVDGYNTCVFAYGQTGSGKTYTMLGTSANKGIVTQAVKKLFGAKHMLEGTSQGQTTVEISVELLEVYNEQIRDLVSTKECDGSGAKKLNISLNSNEALGNTVHVATSEEEVSDILAIAQKRRCVKATKSNEESSRSHLIFTMNFIVRSSSGERRSKLHICDLAGSERLSKSQAVGSTLKETQHINKSLSTLSNVIEKLQQKSSHVPFRESKLTYLLRNSLGGDSKTLAIVCCNPLTEHFQETTCSLRFAQKLNKVELQAVGSISC
jgi:kinesin family protein C1